jgi:hypothetical protein
MNVFGIVILSSFGMGMGCSDGGEVVSQSSSSTGAGASCGEGPGIGGAGGGAALPEKVRAGFGNSGNSNFMHDLVESTSADVSWSASCYLSYTALGAVEAGNCQTTLGMVLGGVPQLGKEYVLNAVANSPADGTGYATVAESCVDAGTNKVWRSTGGILVVDSIVGKRVALIYSAKAPISLAPDMTAESNDAMGTMIMTGYANIDIP